MANDGSIEAVETVAANGVQVEGNGAEPAQNGVGPEQHGLATEANDPAQYLSPAVSFEHRTEELAGALDTEGPSEAPAVESDPPHYARSTSAEPNRGQSPSRSSRPSEHGDSSGERGSSELRNRSRSAASSDVSASSRSDGGRRRRPEARRATPDMAGTGNVKDVQANGTKAGKGSGRKSPPPTKSRSRPDKAKERKRSSSRGRKSKGRSRSSSRERHRSKRSRRSPERRRGRSPGPPPFGGPSRYPPGPYMPPHAYRPAPGMPRDRSPPRSSRDFHGFPPMGPPGFSPGPWGMGPPLRGGSPPPPVFRGEWGGRGYPPPGGRSRSPTFWDEPGYGPPRGSYPSFGYDDARGYPGPAWGPPRSPDRGDPYHHPADRAIDMYKAGSRARSRSRSPGWRGRHPASGPVANGVAHYRPTERERDLIGSARDPVRAASVERTAEWGARRGWGKPVVAPPSGTSLPGPPPGNAAARLSSRDADRSRGARRGSGFDVGPGQPSSAPRAAYAEASRRSVDRGAERRSARDEHLPGPPRLGESRHQGVTRGSYDRDGHKRDQRGHQPESKAGDHSNQTQQERQDRENQPRSRGDKDDKQLDRKDDRHGGNDKPGEKAVTRRDSSREEREQKPEKGGKGDKAGAGQGRHDKDKAERGPAERDRARDKVEADREERDRPIDKGHSKDRGPWDRERGPGDRDRGTSGRGHADRDRVPAASLPVDPRGDRRSGGGGLSATLGQLLAGVHMDRACFFYQDPQGRRQGPCSLGQFHSWVQGLRDNPKLRQEYLQFLGVQVWKDNNPNVRIVLSELLHHAK